LHLLDYRLPNIFTERIGHLALEPDCLIRLQLIGKISCRYKWIILSPKSATANQHLLNYWSQYFYVVQNPIACFFFKSIKFGMVLHFDTRRIIRKSAGNQEAYEIYAKSTKLVRKTLSLTSEDEIWSSDQMAKLGLPKDSWFVCVHAREIGFSVVDDDIQSYRNHDITNMLASISEITNRGGWVIRIGHKSMKKLPPLPHVIDYVHHPMKSDRFDMVLCAKAKFILGNSSGIALLGTIFGTPCALSNLSPFSTLWLRNTDISIPKLLWLEDEKRYLRASEILSSTISNFQFTEQYVEKKIIPIESSSDDILSLTKEMFELLERQNYNIPNWQQEKINSLFKANLKPHHYGYGSIANISEKFVKKYTEIFT